MTIRDAAIWDARGLAQARINTWRSAYRGIVSEETLQGLSVEADTLRWEQRLANPPTDAWFVFVDEDEARQVTGFCCGGPERSGDKHYDGEVYALYVLPEHQRRGSGKALLEAAARRLRSHRFEHLLIWVLADNPARQFYEKMGGVAVRRQEIEIGGELYSEVGYGWETLEDLAGEILSCD